MNTLKLNCILLKELSALLCIVTTYFATGRVWKIYSNRGFQSKASAKYPKRTTITYTPNKDFHLKTCINPIRPHKMDAGTQNEILAPLKW